MSEGTGRVPPRAATVISFEDVLRKSKMLQCQRRLVVSEDGAEGKSELFVGELTAEELQQLIQTAKEIANRLYKTLEWAHCQVEPSCLEAEVESAFKNLSSAESAISTIHHILSLIFQTAIVEDQTFESVSSRNADFSHTYGEFDNE